MTAAPVLVEVRRAGVVESAHTGHVVIVDASGAVCAHLGDPAVLIYPRSTVKPLQAAAMIEAGLDLTGSDLALAAASHSGEPFHVHAVRGLLSASGLSEADLRCPPDLPYGDQARIEHLAAGGTPARVLMNCSGKHAAMLRTCVLNQWPLATYPDPDHPLQRHIHARIGAWTGARPAPTSVDGCGAPLWGLPLAGLARAMVALPEHAAGTRVAEAMRTHPEYSGGTTRDVTHLMRGVPGLVAKDGAESVQAMVVNTARGRFGIALKIADGGQRARPLVAAAVLQALGLQAPVLTEHVQVPVLGGGRAVGTMTASPELASLYL
ncbi:MAG: asparaginase [Candidatus Nanopelagicales bacterium]